MEMSYCYEKGIAHSKYLSWAPEDRAKMMAFSYERAEICTLCGTADWEWTENPYAYEPTEKFCKGCYMKETAADDQHRLPGTTIELHPVTEMYRAQQQVTLMRRSQMDIGQGDEDG